MPNHDATYRRKRGPLYPRHDCFVFTNLDTTLFSICIRCFKLTLALYCNQLLDLVMYLNCTLKVHLEDDRMYVCCKDKTPARHASNSVGCEQRTVIKEKITEGTTVVGIKKKESGRLGMRKSGGVTIASNVRYKNDWCPTNVSEASVKYMEGRSGGGL